MHCHYGKFADILVIFEKFSEQVPYILIFHLHKKTVVALSDVKDAMRTAHPIEKEKPGRPDGKAQILGV